MSIQDNDTINSDTYKTIASFSHGLYKEKGSRFISVAIPISDADEIKPVIEKIRKEHHEARHHCYAYMIGHERLIWRVNDDGEPSGTAGRPILGQINSLALTDIAIIVTRYFGGTLLGVSGLINAYRSAAASALENASLIEKTVQEYYEVTFPYISMNDVMRILKDENLGQSGQSFNLECKLILNFRLSSKEKVLARLSRIDSLNLKYIETR
jgi:uncharacterized YigZ family protein